MDKQPKVFGHQFYLSWSEILMGCAVILLGVVLIIIPGIATATLLNLLGAAFIVIGLIHIIRYLMADASTAIGSNHLSIGLIWVVAGVLVIVFKGVLIALLPVLFGMVLLVGGIGKLQGALDARRMKANMWYLALIAAACSVILGVLILLNPFSTALLLMRVIGISLVLEGILDMVTKARLEKIKSTFFVNTHMNDQV